jgi:prophage maintenance system killer protein
MNGLNYLTVQDILWINLQVTKKVQRYNYAKLEEAAFYQYAYGDSKDLSSQAARFLPGFLKMKPFEVANEATAFVACLSFLVLNGQTISLSDGNSADDWLTRANDRKQTKEAIQSVTATNDHHHPIDVRTAVETVLKSFPKTLDQLTKTILRV